MKIKDQLNASQYDAVTSVNGPLLVIAGAGSGKTRVIEYRVLHLIETGIAPESILLLTFTRKASREMLSRAERHNSLCRNVDGGTFHSFAYKMLKKYSSVIGLGNSFTIIDESDQEDLIHRCMVRMGMNVKHKRFPKKGTIKNIISAAINKGIKLSQVLDSDYPHFIEYEEVIGRIAKEYVRSKVDKTYLDYDDLLIYLRMLLEKKDINDKVSDKYRYVMIDEYQDTNHMQGDIAYLLAKKNRNIMIVGDDAQSIYGFRGASHENIMKFPSLFPECKVIKLEQNYRSTQPILSVANSVLDNMTNKYAKSLLSVRDEDAPKPPLLFFKDIYQEAEWVADKMLELNGKSVSFSDIAVLFRSAFVSIPLQAELSKRNIPYQIFGGLKFYETAHVKDLISHVKIALNHKDELSWHRVLTLIDGIGTKNAERLTELIIKQPCLEDAIEQVLVLHCEGLKFSKSLKRLSALLKNYGGSKKDKLAFCGKAIEYYEPLMKLKFDDWHLRTADLESIRQIVQRYDSVNDFVADLSIEPPERSVAKAAAYQKNSEHPVTLSTIHSAKGLEWKYVFIIGLSEGLLPIGFALEKENELEEENRLFYVAVTRAKDELFLSVHHESARGGLNQFNRLSRFVDAPNVLSALDSKPVFDCGNETSVFDRLDDGSRLFGKDELFDQIIDTMI